MHIMVDLETMGTRPDAPIISIGAVSFNADGIVDTFYRSVSLHSSVRSGAVIDPSTVMWWLQQDDQARAALRDAQAGEDGGGAHSLEESLRDFGQLRCIYGDRLKGVWGNGATFDNVIIRESCRRLGIPQLWEFWLDRCYRTVKSMYPNIKMERTGVHHNALDDARSQALHLIEISKVAGRFL